jgi:Co/Zn/Cd efflux system component
LAEAAILNGILFAGVFAAGLAAGSWAVQALAVDALNIALTASLGLAFAHRPDRARSRAALAKAFVLAGLGLFVFAGTAIQVFLDRPPAGGTMIAAAALALAGNGLSALRLRALRDDPEIRPLWLFSRNDMAGSAVVLLAAGAVSGTGTDWPDLIVGLNLAVLGLHAALLVLREAREELRSGADRGALASPYHLIAAEPSAGPESRDDTPPAPAPAGWRSLAQAP